MLINGIIRQSGAEKIKIKYIVPHTLVLLDNN